MKSFFEFLNEMKIKGVNYRPNCVPVAIPKTGFRNSGPSKMKIFALSIAPSRPYQAIFRAGKSSLKSGIMGKKH